MAMLDTMSGPLSTVKLDYEDNQSHDVEEK